MEFEYLDSEFEFLDEKDKKSQELTANGLKEIGGMVEAGLSFIPKGLASIGLGAGAGAAGLASVLGGADLEKTAKNVQEIMQLPFSENLTSEKGAKYQKKILDEFQNLTEGISNAFSAQEGVLNKKRMETGKPLSEAELKGENSAAFLGDILGNIWMPGDVLASAAGAKSKRPVLTPEQIAKQLEQIDGKSVPKNQPFVPSGQQEMPFERVNAETLPPNEAILAQMREQALAEHEGIAQQIDMANQRATGQTNLFTENINPVPRQETPLPALEQPGGLPRLPEQAMGETPLPFVPEMPNKYSLKQLPEEPVQRQLGLTPDDQPIPHVPNPQFENVLPARESLLPEQNLFDALLNKDADAQRIRDMEANTRTEQLRGERSSIDFPLRQEILERPDIKQAIDNFRIEAERLKDMPEQLAKLQEEFAAGMRMLGIDKASDAYGKALYEAGMGTKLPVEKSLTLKEQAKAGEKSPWSDFARTNKMPPNPLGTRNKMGRFVPKSQRGMVDPKVFLEGIKKLANSVKIGSRIKMNLPWVEGGYEVDAVIKNTVYKDENGRVTSNTNPKASPYYDLEYIINGEKINNSFSSTQLLENGKTLGGIPLGQTAKGASQRGGRKVDPDYIKFKNRLPKNMQQHARQLYEAWQEKHGLKQVESIPGQNKEAAITEIPGLHKVTEEVAPLHEKSVEEMKPYILSSPDTNMGMLGRAWRTGAQLTGFETKNVLIRYVGDIVNNAVRAYEVASKNILKDPKNGVITKIEALPLKDRTTVREAMRAMEGKEGTIDMSLWTPQMKEAHAVYRKAMDDGFTFANDVRRMLGMKPLPYRHNYLPSRWEGDFLIPVYDKDGDMVHILTTSNKLAARNARKEMQRLHPDYTFGEVEYRSVRQHSKDLEASQRDVMSILAEDDPRMWAMESVFEELLSKQTYGTQNFKKHFEAKRKKAMGGFQGGKEWLSPEQNAKEGFQSDVRYLEQLYKWGELQKAGQKINKILADPEIKASQKNAILFAKNYWEGVSGHGTKTQKVLDGVVDLFGEYSGWGATNIKTTGRILKTAMTIKFLGLGNIAYMGSQAWQPMQMMPAWMEYLRSKGAKGNWAVSATKADLDIVSPMNKKSEFGKEASKWAHDNHVADSYILDDISDAGSGKVARSLESMVQYLTPAKIEIFSRYSAFMNYAHYLNDSGVPKMQAFESAAKMVDMSMTNYHLHERPMLYRNLGFVGDMASSFTSFKHNQWQQLAAFGKKGHRMGLAPLIGMQLVSGGLMGLYARDEIDALIKGLNKTGLFEDYIPTIREILLRKDIPDAVNFGVISAVTGMDMSSKFSAADVLPNGPIEAFLPFYNDWAKMLDSLGEVASRRSDESVRQAAHAFAPTSAKWLLEDPIAFGESQKRRDGEVMTNPATATGLAKRDIGDRLARVAGAYSLKEARERFALMEEKNQSKWQADRSASILRKAKDLEPDDKGMAELGRQYARLGGDVREIEQALNAHQQAKFMTAFEQERGNALTTDRQLLKAKRMQGYERK